MGEIDRRMQENIGQSQEEQRRKQEALMLITQSNQDHLEEDNDRAKDLEEKARQLDLGKNLEARVDIKKAAPKKEPKEKLPPPRARGKSGSGDDEQGEDRRERRGKKEKKDKLSKKEKKEK